MTKNLPSQDEIGQAFYKILAYGDEAKIAERIGKSPGAVSQWWNPNNDIESNMHKAINELAALMDINTERGERALNLFCTYVRMAKVSDKPQGLGLNHETSVLNKEVSEFVSAKLQDAPFDVQMKELVDAQMQLENVKQELIAEYNRLKDEPRGLRRVG